MEFESFNKIPRVEKMNNQVIITEKIDGSNGQVAFDEEGKMWVGSRNRWIQPVSVGGKSADNFGFAEWCYANEEELRKLGPGRHYGEWYGRGIGPHGYGLEDRRFALFNTRRWGAHNPNTPACCQVVPVMFHGEAMDLRGTVDQLMEGLRGFGSVLVKGFMKPEGLVIYLPAQDSRFKALLYTARSGMKEHPSPIEHPEAV